MNDKNNNKYETEIWTEKNNCDLDSLQYLKLCNQFPMWWLWLLQLKKPG